MMGEPPNEVISTVSYKVFPAEYRQHQPGEHPKQHVAWGNAYGQCRSQQEPYRLHDSPLHTMDIHGSTPANRNGETSRENHHASLILINLFRRWYRSLGGESGDPEREPRRLVILESVTTT
jgi:hypothetical protein